MHHVSRVTEIDQRRHERPLRPTFVRNELHWSEGPASPRTVPGWGSRGSLVPKQTWQLPTTLFWWDHFNPAQTVFLDELLKHPGSFHMIQGLGQIREASRISFRDCNTR